MHRHLAARPSAQFDRTVPARHVISPATERSCDLRSLIVASLTTACVSGGLAAPALAADLGVRAPTPVYTKAPAAVPFSWSGFYIGGNVGAVTARASGTSDFLDTLGTNASNPQTNSFSSTNALAGGQIGYNWQVDPRWVIGIEGDWDWTRARYSACRQTDVGGAACFDNNHGFETLGAKTDWLATARARVGFTLANVLLYGTGGAAWGRVKTDLSQDCLKDGCGSTSTTQLFTASTAGHTKAGWVAGFGAEAAIDTHWSVRAEWLHIDLGTITDRLSSVGASEDEEGGSSSGTQTTVWSRNERFDEFRVGANYRFQ
jgi:outer membrane immunogenic protein